jgi:hypothetical protein
MGAEQTRLEQQERERAEALAAILGPFSPAKTRAAASTQPTVGGR